MVYFIYRHEPPQFFGKGIVSKLVPTKPILADPAWISGECEKCGDKIAVVHHDFARTDASHKAKAALVTAIARAHKRHKCQA